MPALGFADLVAAVAEGMGQHPDSVRSTPDGYLLHTSDGFLFAFLEDPAQVSLASIQRLLEQPAGPQGKLVLLTPGRLPLALSEAAAAGRASLVEHERFKELLRGLDLGALVGEEPRGPHDVPGARLLPSARHLDAVVARARTWFEWGVPALALRFYRQALAQKPGFGPARVGIGRCLAALGLTREALATFEEILRDHPGDVEARLGIASVHGQTGHHREEIEIYREVLAEAPDRDDVRAQLIAAEIDLEDWSAARANLERMIRGTPEAPKLRYLLGFVLDRAGDKAGAKRERDHARGLGLTPEEEKGLTQHLAPPRGRTPAEPPLPPPVATPPPAAPVSESLAVPGENPPPRKVSARRTTAPGAPRKKPVPTSAKSKAGKKRKPEPP